MCTLLIFKIIFSFCILIDRTHLTRGDLKLCSDADLHTIFNIVSKLYLSLKNDLFIFDEILLQLMVINVHQIVGNGK
jgi:hypothetical protein